MNLKRIKRRFNILLDMFGLPIVKHYIGDIYLITTNSRSKGEEDFRAVLDSNNIKLKMTLRMDFSYGAHSLENALQKIKSQVKNNDVIAIVRGGGDVETKQFITYNSVGACNLIDELQDRYKIIIVTGIGHAADRFKIDEHATYSSITPTAAAHKIVKLIKAWEA